MTTEWETVAQHDASIPRRIRSLPIRYENTNAVGYVCTTPEEGLAQLQVLIQLGCKPHHRVLEIGCGALVAGFPVMQYLDAGHYAGIDPNGWLTESSMGLPEVAAILREKHPRFFQSSNFRTGIDEKFDFILSHSILSHASQMQLRDFLAAAAEQLAPGGVLAASLRLAEGNEWGSPGSPLHGADFTEWQYPGVSWFTREEAVERAKLAGFSASIDPELTRTILRGNPKAIHDWLAARREGVPSRRIFLGVPCFAEDRALLLRALRSFCEPDVSVVAVDNGGSQAVKAALHELTGTIEVIPHETNTYVNPAWNELAAKFLESEADVFVLANADLVVSSGWARSILQRHDAARAACRREWWVGCGVETVDEVTSRHANSSSEATDNPRHTAGAFFAMSREAVAAAFPIPTELRLWYGDTWIQTVLAEAGFTIVTLRDVVAWHAGKVSSNRLSELPEMVAREGELWDSQISALAKERGSMMRAPEIVVHESATTPITLVSAFFRLRDRTVDEDEAFRRFGELAACGLPIILFLDEKLLAQPPAVRGDSATGFVHVSHLTNVRVIPMTLENLWPFQRKKNLPLPTLATPGKDTRDFLLLQNAKLDLLAMARKLDSAQHFAWIDFGVMKVVKHPASFLDRLRALEPPPSCVLAPGCWSKERSAVANDSVNWRFCGGFLLVGREAIPALVERYHSVFSRLRQLTWEVNVWAEMERKGQRFDWYQADHDDTLIGGDTGKKLCLVMIVKNESAIIERCLTAALPFIDSWVITDTGSTDGTPETIERFFAKHHLPGKIAKTTFRNFAQARNESLEAARLMRSPRWDYALLIDADMVLQGSLDKLSLDAPAYRLKQTTLNLTYWNTRLVRRDADASYLGVTHEYLSVAGTTPPNLDVLFIDDRNDGGSKGDKGDRDIRLLNEGLATDPTNGRYMFYLANTYREMGRHAEAIQWYMRRIAAGGWDEEVWAAYYGIARSQATLNDEPGLILACFNAYNFRPTRAEPLSLLSRWWREHGKSDASILIAEEVARIPKTADILFVEDDTYSRKNEVDVAISGYYSKLPARRQAGYDACARLTIDRDQSVRDEARKNFVFYAKSAQELFGAELRAIDWKPDDGYAPMNPSVIVLPGGRRLCLVRTVNYKVSGGQYPTIDNSGIIRTKNWIIELDESWRPTKSTLVIDSTGLERTSYPVEGFEDCRLYTGGTDGSRLYASATVRDLGDGRCEMAILALEEAGGPHVWAVMSARVVRDYEPDKPQKNWMPILGQPDQFLYLCDPTTVIDCKPEGTALRSRITDLDQNLTGLRGGSQVIPYQDGWLCLVHEVVYDPTRVYLHRFVRLSASFEIQVVTEPFFFQAKGIEFAAGLARDGDRLVASYGVNDASAHLAVFESERIDRMLSLPS